MIINLLIWGLIGLAILFILYDYITTKEMEW